MGRTWACQLKARSKSLSSLRRGDGDCGFFCFHGNERRGAWPSHFSSATPRPLIWRSRRPFQACKAARLFTSGTPGAPRPRALHARHPPAGADVELRVQQRSHPRHGHRLGLCPPGDRRRLRRTRGQASSSGNPPEALPRRFRAGFVEVVPELRAKIAFSHYDLLSLRPIREGLSLVVCKNVLLHFDEGQRIKVLQMFHGALQPGGILVMEHTQKLPETLATRFRQVTPYAQVFRKVAEPRAENNASQRHPKRLVDTHGRQPLSHLAKLHCG